MLGTILSALTDPTTAEKAVAAVARREVLARIRQAASTNGVPLGVFVASKIGHFIDHGGEDIWVDLLGVMSGSPQPGAAAIERLLAGTFPDPVRVRITHTHV